MMYMLCLDAMLCVLFRDMERTQETGVADREAHDGEKINVFFYGRTTK